jgi:hypothetical protein
MTYIPEEAPGGIVVSMGVYAALRDNGLLKPVHGAGKHLYYAYRLGNGMTRVWLIDEERIQEL